MIISDAQKIFKGSTEVLRAFAGGSQVWPCIVTDGLVLHLDAANPESYPGSGTTWFDLSGNGNNFTSSNGAAYSQENLGVMTFDGVDDYFGTTTQLINSPTGLTISGWMLNQSFGGNYETVLHHGDGTTVGGSSYWFGFTDEDAICATIGANSGVGWAAGKTTITAEDDTWYHVAATWNGSVVIVFVNGVQVKQYDLSTYLTQNTPTRVGVTSGGVNYQFGGKANGIIIYDKSLSSSEIKQNFEATRNRYGI